MFYGFYYYYEWTVFPFSISNYLLLMKGRIISLGIFIICPTISSEFSCDSHIFFTSLLVSCVCQYIISKKDILISCLF